MANGIEITLEWKNWDHDHEQYEFSVFAVERSNFDQSVHEILRQIEHVGDLNYDGDKSYDSSDSAAFKILLRNMLSGMHIVIRGDGFWKVYRSRIRTIEDDGEDVTLSFFK